MAEAQRAKLSAFETSIRFGTVMKWPKQELSGDDSIGFEPGPADLLILSHAPSRRFLGRDPVHESLMIEIRPPLGDAPQPGPLRFGRVVYRAGAERLAYQATRAMGTLALAEAAPKKLVIELNLTLMAPEVDWDKVGAHHLAGPITVVR